MSEKRKLPFDILDSIRGIASLYVVIAHCRGVLWIGGSEFMRMFPREAWGGWDYFAFGSSMLTRLAVEFVIVFFVLSGFSITHSLSGNTSVPGFYKRRFIRIYPPYVVALIWAGLIFVGTRYLFPQWYDGSLTQFAFIRTLEMNDYLTWDVMLKNLFYMPSAGFISPFWSLTYEVIFYFLAPFILRKRTIYFVVSAVLFLTYMLLPDLIDRLHIPIYIHGFLFVYNVFFALGVFLYTYYDRIMSWFKAYTRFEFIILIVGLLLVTFGANFYLKTENMFTFIEAAILSCVLIIFFLKFEIKIPFLMKIGRFSYTLYITHFASIFLYLALYWLIVKPDTPYIINYLVWMPAVFFCLLIAWVQYMLVEKRSQQTLRKLRSK
jgi:peptidoglycan/LPS O-acetylase OafA/YrhL